MDEYLPEESFTLEDIIREFGSGPDAPPPEPVLPGMETPAPEPAPEPEPLPEPALSPETDAPQDFTDTEPVQDAPEGEALQDAPDEGEPPEAPRKRRREKRFRLNLKTDDALYEDEFGAQEDKTEDYTFSLNAVQRENRAVRRSKWFASPEKACSLSEALSRADKREKSLDRRFRICVVVTTVNLLLAVYNGIGLHWIRGFENVAAMGVISMLLLVCAGVTAYDVLLRGIRQAASTRFGTDVLLTVLCAAALAEAVFAVVAGRLPLCAAVSLELLCALWAERRQDETVQDIAYVLDHSEQAGGVKRVENAWNGKAAAARGIADRDAFEAMVGTQSPDIRVMRIYVPAALGAGVLLAGLGAILGKVNFFWLWTALLLAAAPLSGLLCYVLPDSLLTRQLAHRKAALCGWYGARVLSGCEALFLRDAELFPEGCLKLSGIKAFEAYESAMLMRYAGAILRAVRCDAADLLLEQGDVLPRLEQLRCFDEEGYSAEIEGSTVLLGTFGFMKKMGVHMEHGAKVRQGLYLSVHGELAGIIALRYDADPQVRRTLQTLSGSDAPTPVLVGSDVLVTPGLLRSRFRLPLDRLQFPPLRDRMMYSELSAGEEDLQGAWISRPGLEIMGALCMGARALVSAVRASVVLSLLSGVLGMVMIFILGVSGELTVVSCAQMLGYLLVCAVPFLIAAFSVLKR